MKPDQSKNNLINYQLVLFWHFFCISIKIKKSKLMKLINENEPVFTIGVVAQKLGISKHMIRIYEREGIPYRKESGHRLFSQRDIERIKCVRGK